MTGLEVIRAILDRESLSPTRVSVAMGHARTYLNTLINEGRDCKLATLLEFCRATGYEIIVRSLDDGYEFDIDFDK